MTHFSWQKAKDRSLKCKLERAEQQAKGGMESNKDFAIEHPAEVKAAQKKDFTELRGRILKKFDKQDKIVKARRDKLGKLEH